MTIVTKTLIAPGTPFTFGPAGATQPPGFYYGTNPGGNQPGVPNPNVLVANTACPSFVIDVNTSRHTVAVDVAFDQAYLTGGAHFGVISRFGTGNYLIGSDNRGASLIFGAWDKNHRGAVGIEEIRIGPAPGFDNVHHATLASLLQPNRSYRLIIDTIRLNGGVAIEGRIIDNQTGQGIYSTGTIWSQYAGNYDPVRQRTALFNANMTGTPGTVYFTNMKSYWSHATEWVANP